MGPAGPLNWDYNGMPLRRPTPVIVLAPKFGRKTKVSGPFSPGQRISVPTDEDISTIADTETRVSVLLVIGLAILRVGH